MVSYRDLFDPQGAYKLKALVGNAYNMPQRDRGTLEKEVLKLDEKVNICSMIFSGSFMRSFPVPWDDRKSVPVSVTPTSPSRKVLGLTSVIEGKSTNVT